MGRRFIRSGDERMSQSFFKSVELIGSFDTSDNEFINRILHGLFFNGEFNTVDVILEIKISRYTNIVIFIGVAVDSLVDFKVKFDGGVIDHTIKGHFAMFGEDLDKEITNVGKVVIGLGLDDVLFLFGPDKHFVEGHFSGFGVIVNMVNINFSNAEVKVFDGHKGDDEFSGDIAQVLSTIRSFVEDTDIREVFSFGDLENVIDGHGGVLSRDGVKTFGEFDIFDSSIVNIILNHQKLFTFESGNTVSILKSQNFFFIFLVNFNEIRIIFFIDPPFLIVVFFIKINKFFEVIISNFLLNLQIFTF